jgi:hypothetical protein
MNNFKLPIQAYDALKNYQLDSEIKNKAYKYLFQHDFKFIIKLFNGESHLRKDILKRIFKNIHNNTISQNNLVSFLTKINLSLLSK